MYSDLLIRYMLCEKVSTPSAKLLLITLASYTDVDGVCFPSITTLSQVTGLNRATIIRGINTLVAEGHIVRLGNEHKSTTYGFTLIMEDIMEGENSRILRPEVDSNNIISLSSKSKNTSGRNLRPSDPMFYVFWQAYPRRVGKGHARQAFEKAKRFASVHEIIEGAKKFAVHVADREPQYIPHPTTWLNGERWEDDLETEVDNRSTTEKKGWLNEL